MTDTTSKLGLPLIAAQQAQKHVTHNEALATLDVLVQASVKDRDLATPPSAPAEGDMHIVAATATDAWAGHENELAEFRNGGWVFHAPREGWRAWVEDEDALLAYDGMAWKNVARGVQSLNPADGGKVGVNATADDANRLAVKSDAVLFSHDDATPGTGDVRFKVNKAAADKTASLLFQDGFSGRAEIGLAGDDDLHVKVSSDGGVWREALRVDAATGKVVMPSNMFVEAAIFNLFSDGGRFAGAPEPQLTVGGFVAPSWAVVDNGATLSGHAKFHRNSSSYGGAAPALDAHVKQLVDMLMHPGFRRYYPEFWVAKLAAGDGTGSSLTFPGATTLYTMMYTAGNMRPPSTTDSVYVKVLSGPIGFPVYSYARTRLDGEERTDHFIVPDDGEWHHVQKIEGSDFSRHYRYEYSAIRFYGQNGSIALLAFPAMIPGQVVLPGNVGQVPGTKTW